MLLPLDSFRRLHGMNPWHFWQFAGGAVPLMSSCNDLTHEYAWQGADAAGRSDIRAAIGAAEDRLGTELGVAVAPRSTAATLPFTNPLVLPEGFVQALGAPVDTVIGTPAVLVNDADSDGLNDSFTCSVATAATNAAELFVRFRAADDPTQRPIAPVSVAISSGVATISGPLWLLAKPLLYERPNGDELDPADSTNFVQQVEIVRRTVDATQAATLITDAPSACCLGASGDMQLTLANAERGIVRLSATCWPWVGCPPDRITVQYVAGAPLTWGQMQPQWQTVVARLAAAELARPICACEDANRALYHWQFDLARARGAMDEQYAISPADLDNPLGTRRGHVYAWRMIKQHRRIGGVLV